MGFFVKKRECRKNENVEKTRMPKLSISRDFVLEIHLVWLQCAYFCCTRAVLLIPATVGTTSMNHIHGMARSSDSLAPIRSSFVRIFGQSEHCPGCSWESGGRSWRDLMTPRLKVPQGFCWWVVLRSICCGISWVADLIVEILALNEVVSHWILGLFWRFWIFSRRRQSPTSPGPPFPNEANLSRNGRAQHND